MVSYASVLNESERIKNIREENIFICECFKWVRMHLKTFARKMVIEASVLNVSECI